MENQTSIKEILICDDSVGLRIDKYIADASLGFSRTFIQKLIKSKDVNVNGNPISSRYTLKKNDKITINIPLPTDLRIQSQDIKLDVLYEDNDLIVVNKPYGMVVHPAAGNYSGTLVNALLYHCKDLSGIGGVQRPGIVHRLDKGTSGVLVVAKTDKAHNSLSKQIKDRSVNREYIALVNGRIRFDEGIINKNIGRHPRSRQKMSVISDKKLMSKEAITEYSVIERYDNYSLVQLKLRTGRTHQIRVHMASIGHSIVGDSTYGKRSNEFGVKRQMLHAKLLGFIHPVTEKYMEFKAEPPEDFKDVITSLSKRIYIRQ